MSGSVNCVVLVGNLTRDPELRALSGGGSVCSLRLAVNESVKDARSGGWSERANYLNVDVFGGLGENCGQWLAKGRQVAVDGRLRWREWETSDGTKRSAVSVVADKVQFLGKRDGHSPQEDAIGEGEESSGAGGQLEDGPDDDIPF